MESVNYECVMFYNTGHQFDTYTGVNSTLALGYTACQIKTIVLTIKV
jgi:hypothetical protein